MTEPVLSYELKTLLNKIKKSLVLEYPIQIISLNYLVYAILDIPTHEMTTWLSTNTLSKTLEDFRVLVSNKMAQDASKSVQVDPSSIRFAKEYSDYAEEISDNGNNLVSSTPMFIKILSSDQDYIRFLTRNGLDITQAVKRDDIQQVIEPFVSEQVEEKNEKKRKKKTVSKPSRKNDDGVSEHSSKISGSNVRLIPEENNIVEANSTNMVREASHSRYQDFVGLDGIVDNIFDVLGKCDRNSVILTGDRGVGKSSVLKRMAQRIYAQDCPKLFREKYVMRFDNQISDVMVKEMDQKGKYIACIDDIERYLANKEIEQAVIMGLKEMMNAPNIMTVFTINDAAYAKYVEPKPEFARLMQKIKIYELSGDNLFNAVKLSCEKLSEHHSMNISDDIIKSAIQLSKRYITKEKRPSSTLDLIDTSCSGVRMRAKDSEEVVKTRDRLFEIAREKSLISNSSSAEDFDRKDGLIREEIDLKKKLAQLESKNNEKKLNLTLTNVKTSLSAMTGIPMTDLEDNERDKLKNLKSKLLENVVGQDDTVDVICRAVKRQRVGLSNPNRPCVILALGSTGTGKTFVAKQLAKEVYGDEKNMVRLDMSEYADKTSVNKLYGSSAGYVGYEEGGILTEAIKKNNRCVLLLDEVEKADDDVFNVFLQVFDEGMLTDNKGTVVDFKNTIIIMTSNVGAKETSENIGRIGFTKPDKEVENKEIVLKAIRKRFKPEFINRIDNICYFNKLTDDNLITIIKNEIKKVREKVNNLGFDFDKSITEGKLVDSIFSKVKEESEYGARPILREIQHQLEDRLTDYIIDNDVKQGFVFKYSDIYQENDKPNE